MDYSELQKLQQELDQKEKAHTPAHVKTGAEESQREHINHSPLQQTPSQKTNERTHERMNEKPKARKIERHSFDIFSDQKMGLDELQLMLYRKQGKKPKSGR